MLPFVTVIIPVLNEQRFLDRCLGSLLDDSYPRDRLEIYVMDGGSTDRTVEIAQQWAVKHPYLRVIPNPRHSQSAAFNIAMREAKQADYLLRCDAHALYPPNFITTAVDVALARHDDAAIIVFAAAAKADTCFQHAVAFVQTNPLGVGGSEYRLGNRSMYVEHGWHGLFKRANVLAAGGYDESFTHNEDAELSLRMHKNGDRVWLDRRLAPSYFPRSTPRSLMQQMWRYGRGRCQTIMKHGTRMKPRQLAPVALAAGTPLLLLAIALAAIGAVPTALGWLAALPLAIYLLAVSICSLYGAIRRGEPCLLLGLLAFPIVHYAWGAGFISRWVTDTRKRGQRGESRPERA